MTVEGEFFGLLMFPVIALFSFAVVTALFRHSYGKDYEGKLHTADKIAIILIYAVTGFVSMFILGTTQYFDDIITYLFVACVFFAFPFALTYLNIKNLVTQNNKAVSGDIATIITGGIYWIMLVSVFKDLSGASYHTAIYPHQYHEIINSEYGTVIGAVSVISVISLLVLCKKPDKLPPLVSALSTAFTSIGLAIFLLIHIQLLEHFDSMDFMLWLYWVNLVILSARRIQFHIKEQVRLAHERQTAYRSDFALKLAKITESISKMKSFSFMLILPIAVIIEILYIILGQGADGFIKAFTQTADWTFSQQIPPPPIEYDGHYLCTVAVCGHRKIVKPLRYGIRNNDVIIVNRQLLIANAFEDLIMEKTPKFHKKVRSFYNAHGYPVSKYINTPLRSDIVYILMKPLEWLFLLTLYLFDPHPENRIAVQYSGYKK